MNDAGELFIFQPRKLSAGQKITTKNKKSSVEYVSLFVLFFFLSFSLIEIDE